VSLINFISSYLLSKKEGPETVKQFFSWNQLNKILIICYDYQLDELTYFLKTCKTDNINVYVAIIYKGKIEQAPSPNFKHTIVDQKQFSFFKIPTPFILKNLNTRAFDLLINLGSDNQMRSLALSKLVYAKCKISNFQNTFFDLTINKDNLTTNSDYLKQVIVYLNMIKTT
jgi:hypothetical protein